MSKRVITLYRKKYVVFHAAELRRKTKLLCIEYKGGKCEKCGYNKCPAALVFHHTNPDEKEFGLSESGTYRSFEKCKPELDKCMLLCMICHAELHHEEDKIKIEESRKELENLKHSRVS